MRLLYTLTIFISAFLLFLIQPLVAKMILPTFGGAPAVWNASLVFFQGTLLLGYLYAHFSARWLGKNQPYLHVAVLAIAGITLPFSTKTAAFTSLQDQMATSGSANPAGIVLLALAILVGLPFFAISAGAPTIQRWFARTDDPRAHDPYFLYAASNLGSMIALFAYPLYFESHFRLAEQAQIWTILYGVLVAGMALCGLIALRARPVAEAASIAEPRPEPTTKGRLLWVVLAAVPSALLMGTTNFITGNIAPIPMLWIVPLALYLLTFILAFTNRPLLNSVILSRITPLVLVPLMIVVVMEDSQPLVAVFHLLGMFMATWMCHSRLYDLRPNADRLTEFYSYVSLGGVIGGAFVGLLAPSIFPNYWEYPIALAAAAALKLPYKPEQTFRWSDAAYGLAALLVTMGAIKAAPLLMPHINLNKAALMWAVPAVMVFVASDRPARFGLSFAAVFIAWIVLAPNVVGRILTGERSFFGVNRVSTSPNLRFHKLVHGNTLHGQQDIQRPSVPLTYYYPTGPIGQVFKAFKPKAAGAHVALVGLGVGSLAAYGEPGERMTYFEIDPLIEKVARNPKYFTFLRDTKAKLDVVIGDARLSLARQPDGEFDFIVLDAFSSDAIPVHLLTQEAMAMYAKKLKPGGFIAYHISNRYLNLEPVVANNAAALGWKAWSQVDGPSPDEADAGKTASSYMVVAKNEKSLSWILGRMTMWGESLPDTAVRPWTDDYSNVLGVFSLNN